MIGPTPKSFRGLLDRVKSSMLAGKLLLPAAAVVLCVGWVAAQQVPPPDVPATVLRVNTRLVLVDVVVTDKKGQPVTDLTLEAFTLLENGKLQQIAFFDQPAQRLKEEAVELPLLPPHVYTNRPKYRKSSAPPTILLLDGLNTPTKDQSYARLQLLRYVDTQLEPGQQVAVFALANSLSVLQDFTDDPRLMRAAIASFTVQESQNLAIGDVKGREPPPTRYTGEATPNAPRARIKDGGAPPSSNDIGKMLDEKMRTRIEEFLSEQATLSLKARVAKTVAAFRLIARAVEGYPGRKSLIWVSQGFPLARMVKVIKRGGGEAGWRGQVRAEEVFDEDLRKAAAFLADARIAVYPVDARGLMVSQFGGVGNIGRSLELSGLKYSTEVSSRDTLPTMRLIARDTGGRVFANRNDIDRSVALSVVESSSYYLLGYYPQDKRENGKFRKIQIKIARPGLGKQHRRGYYAVAAKNKKKNKDKDSDLLAAMRPGSLPATTIIFDSRVIPPRIANRMQVPVEFLVDVRTLTFDELAKGGRRYDLEFRAVAFAPDGKVAAHKETGVNARIGAENLAALQAQGLPFRAELELQPGRYQLCLAVQDKRTGFFGTTQFPLILEEPVAGSR